MMPETAIPVKAGLLAALGAGDRATEMGREKGGIVENSGPKGGGLLYARNN